VRIRIDVEGKNLMAEIPAYILDEMDLAVGNEVFLLLRKQRIRDYEKNYNF